MRDITALTFMRYRSCQLIKTYNVNVYNNTYDGCSGPGIQVGRIGICHFLQARARNLRVTSVL